MTNFHNPPIAKLSRLIDVRVIRKTADQTLTQNTTVLQDVTDLVFPIAVNEVWEITLYLLYTSGVAPDLHMRVTLPAGGEAVFVCINKSTTLVHNVYLMEEGLTFAMGGEGAAVRNFSLWKGVITNGGLAGNVQIEAAQDTADLSDTVVLENSCIIARRLS